MSEDEDKFDRRAVLKTLGLTALVGGGLGAASGNAAAARKTLQDMKK